MPHGDRSPSSDVSVQVIPTPLLAPESARFLQFMGPARDAEAGDEFDGALVARLRRLLDLDAELLADLLRDDHARELLAIAAARELSVAVVIRAAVMPVGVLSKVRAARRGAREAG